MADKALVTGAQGFAGSWLAKALLERRRDRRRLRPWRPGASGLELQGIASSVEVVSGDLTDADLLTATIAEREIDGVFHLAAQTIVGTANQSPVPDLRGQHPRHLDAAGGLQAEPGRRGRRRLVRQGLRRTRGAALPRGRRASAHLPYDVSKAATDLIARSYWHTYGLPVAVTRFANIYGGGDLNSLTPDPRGGQRGDRRPAVP